LVLVSYLRILNNLDEGKIYKIVQWRDAEGEFRSELIDILEGTYPEPVRAMDISTTVSLYLRSTRTCIAVQCKVK